MAGVRPRGYGPLLFPAPSRSRLYQIKPAKDHRRRHRLAFLRRAQTRVEGMSKRSGFLLLLALLVSPAALPAHEAGGGNGLPVIGPAPPSTLTSQDNKSVS